MNLKTKKQLCPQLILTLLGIIGTAIGAALTIKADIGIGAWDVLNAVLASITKIKIGTCAMIINCLCVVAQAVILKRNFKALYLLQVPTSIILGFVVNFMLYEFLAPLQLSAYWARLALYGLGNVFIIGSLSLIMAIGIVSFPLEALSLVLADHFRQEFGKVRQGFDLGNLVVATILAFLFSVALPIREGTIIGSIIFGPALAWTLNTLKPKVSKLSYQPTTDLLND